MTKERQRLFVLVFSIMKLTGNTLVSKKSVLDFIQSENYLKLSPEEMSQVPMGVNGSEIAWRNAYAFDKFRLLKSKGYLLNNNAHNDWRLNNSSQNLLFDLALEMIETVNSGKVLAHISDKAVSMARDIVNENFSEFLFKNDLLEDKIINMNTTKEQTRNVIIRYAQIVRELKQIYLGKCQIVECGFTFIKTNGDNYSEGHHIVPLSKGGTQEKRNVVIVCPNHHRMFHFASVKLQARVGLVQSIEINGEQNQIEFKEAHFS